ncbi:MAG: ribosome small subunit-dependent GTPase A [Ruminococcus sp.]|jgi:ribosome biogenesis GTPase|nr:ribosome small subunit-dependent GTPase A [Ruminococcus sp.]MBQ1464276.1 ribosome small subunit-dependent GTPase A [Ruminococcus sp.]
MNGADTSGIIIKCLGGLYSVESPDGIYECRARGVFRNKGISPAVGDTVTISGGVISEIADRRNYIIRPPLANLDQLIFIVSTVSPPPNYLILDKFIAIAEYKNITPVMIITKADLGDSSPIHEIYGSIGIEVLEVDYSRPETIQAVRDILRGRISAFTGNSGAGKSTLLNAVDPTLNIATGEISRKLGRGRHTTRHAELYKLAEGGYIADTPGFSTFETNRYDIIRKDELAGCFREFADYLGDCRFRDCAHLCEKGCKVVEAVEAGKIHKSRHESYCTMYEEAKQLKEWELK